MKFLYLLLTLLIFNNVAHAVDCEDIKNGETFRVDQNGGSLENFHVQDQDGLGSCYANSASLLLQASLENHPEVSYLQLASISKADDLESKRKLAQKADDYYIYAKKEENSSKAINGGGDALKWSLALDGGDICEVVAAAKAQQETQKAAVLCPRKEMNLEAIATNGDPRQSQFKSILESSKYMNLFQGSFSDINKDETFFNRKKIRDAKRKYENFKQAFSSLIAEKKKMLTESSCGTINDDSIGRLVQPAIQDALGYDNCFKDQKNSPYFCKVSLALVSGVGKKGDYSYEVNQLNSRFSKDFLSKLNAPGKVISPEQIKKDFSDTLLSNLKLSKYEQSYAKNFANKLAEDIPSDKLNDIATEFNEIKTTGTSQRCMERSLVDYIGSKRFENDWKQDQVLCENQQLMLQASQVIVEYDKSGLKGIDQALDFLFDKARLNYDEALMAIYALDCKAEEKIEIPKNLTCNATAVTRESKPAIDKKIISSLKSNQPMGIYLCASILNKPKSAFENNECGNRAVAVTGIKCEEGKLKYLIQNSWGKNNQAANPAIQTEEGKGAYWFDEQSFYDSVYNAVSLEKGK